MPDCPGTGKPTASISNPSTGWTRASTSAAWWATARCASTPWASAASTRPRRRPRHLPDAQVVELAACADRFDTMSRRPQRPELRHRHRHELVPARHAAQLPALVVPFREGFELMSRHQLEKLRENRAMVDNGLNILIFD